MSILKAASGGSYLKAGFFGFEKSGKTHTAITLALGTRRFFGLQGPIAMFDTEMSSDYWKERVEAETKQEMLVAKSRSLVDLVETVNECISGKVSVLVVDSVTHVWREVVDSYLAELKAKAKSKGWSPPEELKFSDWNPIKAKWATWSDRFLVAPLHIIVCGRAGFIYDMETNERGKKELIKTGTKLKAESEFGYEASILVEMERETNREGVLVNRATIIGDRFDLINGKSCDFPTFEFFKPFVAKLAPAGHTPVDTSLKTSFDLDEGGNDGWRRECQAREIASEKIKSAFQMAEMDGTSGDQKKRRAEAMQTYWGTTSWKELSEKTPSERLMAGLAAFSAAIVAAQEAADTTAAKPAGEV